jgi:hypothetical protein
VRVGLELSRRERGGIAVCAGAVRLTKTARALSGAVVEIEDDIVWTIGIPGHAGYADKVIQT